ncbi:hypothetical protein MSAN_00122400 [Mycena sanguinolenta]|uniref:Uncharacterized protein n=1 Tax=Mycena sanguinolenta TaxID=230812 RepID=A0A8H6ZDH9_9AGAR|nr:hypothetical protein MSAN_00122400 [Mycena sanguinolenta]
MTSAENEIIRVFLSTISSLLKRLALDNTQDHSAFGSLSAYYLAAEIRATVRSMRTDESRKDRTPWDLHPASARVILHDSSATYSALRGKICDRIGFKLCNNVYDRLRRQYNAPSNVEANTSEYVRVLLAFFPRSPLHPLSVFCPLVPFFPSLSGMRPCPVSTAQSVCRERRAAMMQKGQSRVEVPPDDVARSLPPSSPSCLACVADDLTLRRLRSQNLHVPPAYRDQPDRPLQQSRPTPTSASVSSCPRCPSAAIFMDGVEVTVTAGAGNETLALARGGPPTSRASPPPLEVSSELPPLLPARSRSATAFLSSSPASPCLLRSLLYSPSFIALSSFASPPGALSHPPTTDGQLKREWREPEYDGAEWCGDDRHIHSFAVLAPRTGLFVKGRFVLHRRRSHARTACPAQRA